MEGRGGRPILIFLWVAGEHELDPEAAGDHVDALFRVACAICGSRAVAEDLVQETYVKVLSKPRIIRRDDDLGYLVKALRNTWYSHLRDERTERASTAHGVEDVDELPASASSGARGDPQRSLEASAVLDAVSSLSEPYREAVAAVDVAGLSYSEAARALGVREGTVMSRLYRGREQVARAVGPR
ncbi:MAG: RNA polymerase sigma factor [Actinomycetota bacterium]|nr:RNA polymerase sigma factor [Actinomycetota bacterium]